ncbi:MULTISPECIES: alpha/beta fold hydrolase [unclassified Cryobacterium]|uniref:alpha/beta fold hydrolase n=1 Tax=unclassified Cryobacterium TaxID=2649013 RepID=UPI00141B697C|nr:MULTISPECIES: alpha/beta hydrolase [unclassified Cryobacterium]
MNKAELKKDLFNEFAFVVADAVRLGVTNPLPVRRTAEISATGDKISALQWGVANPEIAFLHGAGLNAHSWDSTALVLGQAAVALDLPGHGESEWRDDADYTPPTIAPSLASVIPKFSSSVRILVGQSLGGLAAIPVASQLRSQLSHLVIVDVTPSFQSKSSFISPVSAFIAGPKSYASHAEVIDRAIEFGIGNNAADLERGVMLNTRVREDGRIIFKHHLASLPAGAHRNFDGEALWPILAELDIDVLLVCGTRGILDAEAIEDFSRHIPSGTVVTLDAGHNVQRDAPTELAALIQCFSGMR